MHHGVVVHHIVVDDGGLVVNRRDPLGRQAGRIAKSGQAEVWTKEMEDGSKAIGLFNRGEDETTVTVKWTDLGLKGRHAVRDLWRQQDVGRLNGEFKAQVPRHGVVLVRLRAR